MWNRKWRSRVLEAVTGWSCPTSRLKHFRWHWNVIEIDLIVNCNQIISLIAFISSDIASQSTTLLKIWLKYKKKTWKWQWAVIRYSDLVVPNFTNVQVYEFWISVGSNVLLSCYTYLTTNCILCILWFNINQAALVVLLATLKLTNQRP